MRIGVPKETADGERRVALVPEVVAKLVRGSAGDDARVLEVVVERGAGAGALIPDQAYADAGGELVDDAAAAFDADVVDRRADFAMPPRNSRRRVVSTPREPS